jgi:hypothetical protein
MSYAITDIIDWAKAAQPLAYYGEKKKLALQHGTIEENLHIKLRMERLSLEYAYAQDPTSDQTYQIGQWVLALCGVYLFEAQAATGGGGSISPVTPGGLPEPIEFVVSASSEIPTGSSTLSIPEYIGFNLIFVRNSITQSSLTSQPTYFTWNRTTGQFTCSPVAFADELFQFYPTA